MAMPYRCAPGDRGAAGKVPIRSDQAYILCMRKFLVLPFRMWSWTKLERVAWKHSLQQTRNQGSPLVHAGAYRHPRQEFYRWQRRRAAGKGAEVDPILQDPILQLSTAWQLAPMGSLSLPHLTRLHDAKSCRGKIS
jgi:hypothetical protein